MESTEATNAQIEAIFNARSVAIVGLPRSMKSGKLFLMALLDQKYPGRIYPVNPGASEIDGLKSYPDVSAIPGPVDLAIILVPSDQVLAAVRACAEKGVKGAVLFTAGYKETGMPEGLAMEASLVQAARAGGMRLIGPNGMGVYAPRSGLSFFPQLSRKPGPVGIISHSGSLTNILGRVASAKGVYFSKMVSLGNECDLSAGDFLDYFAQDQETLVVGAYIEGIKNGPRFLESLRRVSALKPVVMWKVGLTTSGARAALSHTGALAGAEKVLRAVLQQGGAVPVTGFEAWLDALMGFTLISEPAGDRMAIVSGPGGLAVSAAEACGNAGLRLASLLPETRSELARILPPTGTSTGNPIDVGLVPALDIDIYAESVRIAARDPRVDALLVIGAGLSPEINTRYLAGFAKVRGEIEKPLLMVKIPGFDEDLARRFCQAGMPFFDSAERALQTYALIRRHQSWRKRLGG